jgi:hypothetical protein
LLQSGIGRLRGPVAISQFQDAKTVVHSSRPEADSGLVVTAGSATWQHAGKRPRGSVVMTVRDEADHRRVAVPPGVGSSATPLWSPIWRVNATRELTPSLVKTLRRWPLTV